VLLYIKVFKQLTTDTYITAASASEVTT